MKTVAIPGTDLRPSALCLGTNRFGTVIPADDAFALLDAFVEVGGTFLDTAHIYADWIVGAPKSASEKTVGAWLRARGNRCALTIATKGGHPELTTPRISRLSPGELAADLAASLENLGTDRLDLFWLHRDDPGIPVGDILGPLEEFVRQGLISYYGCSNWRAARIAQAQEYAAAHGLHGFAANQPQWSLAVPNRAGLSDPEHLVVMSADDYALHVRTGLACMPWSSQGQGFFEKLARGGVDGLSAGDRRGYLNDLNLERWSPVSEMAERYGATLTAVALSFLISQPFVTVPIVGPRTAEQLRTCVQALDLALGPDDLAFISGGRMAAGMQQAASAYESAGLTRR